MVRSVRGEPWTDKAMATAVREAINDLVDTISEARGLGLTIIVVGAWGQEDGSFSMDVTIKRDL